MEIINTTRSQIPKTLKDLYGIQNPELASDVLLQYINLLDTADINILGVLNRGGHLAVFMELPPSSHLLHFITTREEINPHSAYGERQPKKYRYVTELKNIPFPWTYLALRVIPSHLTGQGSFILQAALASSYYTLDRISFTEDAVICPRSIGSFLTNHRKLSNSIEYAPCTNYYFSKTVHSDDLNESIEQSLWSVLDNFFSGVYNTDYCGYGYGSLATATLLRTLPVDKNLFDTPSFRHLRKLARQRRFDLDHYAAFAYGLEFKTFHEHNDYLLLLDLLSEHQDHWLKLSESCSKKIISKPLDLGQFCYTHFLRF